MTVNQLFHGLAPCLPLDWLWSQVCSPVGCRVGLPTPCMFLDHIFVSGLSNCIRFLFLVRPSADQTKTWLLPETWLTMSCGPKHRQSF